MAAFVEVQDHYLSSCAYPLRTGYANGMEEDWKEKEMDLAHPLGRGGGSGPGSGSGSVVEWIG